MISVSREVNSFGVNVLTVPNVPTGMKAGVWMMP
jgi:hypothetical protein